MHTATRLVVGCFDKNLCDSVFFEMKPSEYELADELTALFLVFIFQHTIKKRVGAEVWPREPGQEASTYPTTQMFSLLAEAFHSLETDPRQAKRHILDTYLNVSNCLRTLLLTRFDTELHETSGKTFQVGVGGDSVRALFVHSQQEIVLCTHCHQSQVRFPDRAGVEAVMITVNLPSFSSDSRLTSRSLLGASSAISVANACRLWEQGSRLPASREGYKTCSHCEKPCRKYVSGIWEQKPPVCLLVSLVHCPGPSQSEKMDRWKLLFGSKFPMVCDDYSVSSSCWSEEERCELAVERELDLHLIAQRETDIEFYCGLLQLRLHDHLYWQRQDMESLAVDQVYLDIFDRMVPCGRAIKDQEVHSKALNASFPLTEIYEYFISNGATLESIRYISAHLAIEEMYLEYVVSSLKTGKVFLKPKVKHFQPSDMKFAFDQRQIAGILVYLLGFCSHTGKVKKYPRPSQARIEISDNCPSVHIPNALEIGGYSFRFSSLVKLSKEHYVVHISRNGKLFLQDDDSKPQTVHLGSIGDGYRIEDGFPEVIVYKVDESPRFSSSSKIAAEGGVSSPLSIISNNLTISELFDKFFGTQDLSGTTSSRRANTVYSASEKCEHVIPGHPALTGGNTVILLGHDFNQVICSGSSWHNDSTVRIPIAIYCQSYGDDVSLTELQIVDSLVYSSMFGKGSAMGKKLLLDPQIYDDEVLSMDVRSSSQEPRKDFRGDIIDDDEMLSRFGGKWNQFSKEYSSQLFDSATIALLINHNHHWSIVMAFNIDLRKEPPVGEKRLFVGIDFLGSHPMQRIIANAKK